MHQNLCTTALSMVLWLSASGCSTPGSTENTPVPSTPGPNGSAVAADAHARPQDTPAEKELDTGEGEPPVVEVLVEHVRHARCEQAQKLLADNPNLELSVDVEGLPRILKQNCEEMIKNKDWDKAYLIDKRAASGLEYMKCVDERKCPNVPYGKFNRQPDYRDEPAMSINYKAAQAYCDYVGKRIPTMEEYQSAWTKLTWNRCCARSVIPREWTPEPYKKEGFGIQVRKTGDILKEIPTPRLRGVDSSTVRCARDLPYKGLDFGDVR